MENIKNNFNLKEFLSNYKPDIDDVVNELQIKYKDILKDYKFVQNINTVEVGGYIKYINVDGEIRGTGIYIKKEGPYVYLKNTFLKRVWKIAPEKYYLFYREHVTKNNCIRNLKTLFESKEI